MAILDGYVAALDALDMHRILAVRSAQGKRAALSSLAPGSVEWLKVAMEAHAEERVAAALSAVQELLERESGLSNDDKTSPGVQ